MFFLFNAHKINSTYKFACPTWPIWSFLFFRHWHSLFCMIKIVCSSVVHFIVSSFQHIFNFKNSVLIWNFTIWIYQVIASILTCIRFRKLRTFWTKITFWYFISSYPQLKIICTCIANCECRYNSCFLCPSQTLPGT